MVGWEEYNQDLVTMGLQPAISSGNGRALQLMPAWNDGAKLGSFSFGIPLKAGTYLVATRYHTRIMDDLGSRVGLVAGEIGKLEKVTGYEVNIGGMMVRTWTTRSSVSDSAQDALTGRYVIIVTELDQLRFLAPGQSGELDVQRSHNTLGMIDSRDNIGFFLLEHGDPGAHVTAIPSIEEYEVRRGLHRCARFRVYLIGTFFSGEFQPAVLSSSKVILEEGRIW